MTTIEQGAYIAALERKLMEAERALYGFRAIFNNFQLQRSCTPDTASENSPSGEQRGPCDLSDDRPRRKGLYPGQIDNHVDASDFDSDVEMGSECIE